MHTAAQGKAKNTIALVLGLLTLAGSTLKSIVPSRVLSFTAGHYWICSDNFYGLLLVTTEVKGNMFFTLAVTNALQRRNIQSK